MHESFHKFTVLRMLKDLDRRDPRRKVFGSIRHQYRLNPPLSLSTVETFERQHGIVLPYDYRMFLTDIGNGGAGPAYGLFSLGQLDHEDGFCSWEEQGLVGDLSKPFPHVDSWNLPDSFWAEEPDPPPNIPLEAEDRIMEAWGRELEAHYWNPAIMNGAIPICDLGCNLRQWLVVNGARKSHVWQDDRADRAGIRPLRDRDGRPQTFSDWYMTWLLQALSQCR